MNKGRPRKQKKFHLTKKQLEPLLENEKLTIEDIARRLNATEETVRKYIFKYGL